METKTLLWELIRNGCEILATEKQDIDDFRVNGRGYMLDALIPNERADAAQDGEWNPEGFIYEFGGDWYLVRYRPIDDYYLTLDGDEEEI